MNHKQLNQKEFPQMSFLKFNGGSESGYGNFCALWDINFNRKLR